MNEQCIIAGDCTKLLTSWEEIDVMITDPPYSDHVHRKAVSQSKTRGARKRELGFECLSPELREYIASAAAGVKRWSCIFSDLEGLGAWRDALLKAGAKYIRAVPWVRWSMPQLSGDRPPSGCELVIVAYGKARGKKGWNGPGNLTHLAHKCMRGENKHKAQKPLDLMLDLVEWFSNPGELVFDPCAGSGTTGVACRELGRNFVGIELSDQWASRASDRLVSALSDNDVERVRRRLEGAR